ncbi:MAG: hypothetical protein LPK79_12495 [Bacteroidota bacterium]|nr:hypothetical protein [Bacteroidota bacterium]MDX5447663.1 hypothetical protein [Bacteroidota bacterium]
MEGQSEKKMNRFQRIARNKSLLTRTAFIFVTFLFWLLIKLSRDGYSIRISVPVEAHSPSSQWMLVDQDQRTLDATITGPGFSLLRFSMFGLDPVSIDLGELPGKNLENGKRVSWPTEAFRMDLAEKIGGDIRIEGVQPDSLHFFLSPRVYRRVPVKPITKLNFQPPFRQRGPIQLSPDSVTIWGPIAWMDTLDHVKTQLITRNAITGAEEGVIGLQWNDRPEWQVDTHSVHFSILAEAFSEGTINVPIDVVFIPERSMVRLFPKTVTITYNAPISVLKNVKPHDFEVTADIRKQKNNNLFLQLTRVPKDVQVISWQPKKVDFLITPL